eukprot:2814263-Pyramimonas_sp.AAC.2
MAVSVGCTHHRQHALEQRRVRVPAGARQVTESVRQHRAQHLRVLRWEGEPLCSQGGVVIRQNMLYRG